jgi:LemA protein
MSLDAKYLIFGGIAAIVIIVVVLLLAYVGIFNGIISSDQTVLEKWGLVEVQYQRRVDLIPSIIAVANKEANFEQETLTKLTQLRTQWQTAPDQAAKVETANQLESTISKLLVAFENYPELKATQAYQDLMVEITGTENRVSYARGEYNTAVKGYNLSVKTFPSSIVAGMNGFKERPYFAAKEGAENMPDVNGLLG